MKKKSKVEVLDDDEEHLPAQRNSFGNTLLPDTLRNLIPLPRPKISQSSNPLGLWWKNKTLQQIDKFAELDAKIARNQRDALLASLESHQAVTTHTARIADTFREYDYRQNIREISLEEGKMKLRLLETQIEKEQAIVEQTRYQTALIAQEVEMSKIDHKVKIKQLKEILGEEEE